MFATKPHVAIREHGEEDSSYLAIIRQRIKLLMEHKGLVADMHKLADVQELLKEQTGTWITDPDTILRMYPEANIKLALYGLDTETTGLVLDAFAHFFLGTTWPTHVDLIVSDNDLNAWCDTFRQQVIATDLGEAA